MKILAVGGGSGGHVTPVVAVLRALKKRQPSVELRFWTDQAFKSQASQSMADISENLPIAVIRAGKLRRYHHLSLLQHVTIPSIFFSNLFDTVKVTIGFIQSVVKLLVWRPDVIFTKGGYVCLPVGLAARLLRIPLVIHESDTHLGLTNRLLVPYARVIGTGAPLEYYPQQVQSKAHYVGVPISDHFHPYSPEQQRAAKQQLTVNPEKPLIVITGGGLGARRINDEVLLRSEALLERGSVILVAGKGQYSEVQNAAPAHPDFHVYSFLPSLDLAMGAADVVITRAGATTLLELAALHKPAIIIPNAQLTGGHQTKNAHVYEAAGAALVISDAQLGEETTLISNVDAVLGDSGVRQSLAHAIAQFARPAAAEDMATLIYQVATKQNPKI